MPEIQEFPDVEAIQEFPEIEEFPDEPVAPLSAFAGPKPEDVELQGRLGEMVSGQPRLALNPPAPDPAGSIGPSDDNALQRVWGDFRASKLGRRIFGYEGAREAGVGDTFTRQGAFGTLASIPGRPFAGAGKAAQAGIGDIAQGSPQNTRAAFEGEPLPIHTEIQNAAQEERDRGEFGVSSLLANISLGMADLAPKMVAMQGGPALAGSVFGTDSDGNFSTRGAAMGAVLPGVAHEVRALTGQVIDAGIASGATWLAQPLVDKAVHLAANQAAMNALMLVGESPELMALAESDPREFKRRVAEIVGSNLAFAVPEAMRQTPLGETFEGEPSAQREMEGLARQFNRSQAEKRMLTAPAEGGIEEFPPESQPSESPLASPLLGMEQGAGNPTEGAAAIPASSPVVRPVVPESGTVAAIEAEKPVTAQRTARIEASRQYTTEQALADLPNVVLQLKAVLEANRLGGSQKAKPNEALPKIEELPAEPLPGEKAAGVSSAAGGDLRGGARAGLAGKMGGAEGATAVEKPVPVVAANDASGQKQSLPNSTTGTAERKLNQRSRGSSEYTILDAVKDHGPLGGPDLETAMRQMAAGKTASQVTQAYGAEYDGLSDVLESIFEARKTRANSAEAKRLAKAYEFAGFGGDKPGVDQALQGVQDAHREGMGVAGGMPRDEYDLIGRAWEAGQRLASGKAELPQTAEGKAELFYTEATQPENARGLRKLFLGDLRAGDTFRLRRKGVLSEELTVKDVDPESGVVQVKGGEVFGTQDLPQDTPVLVAGGKGTDRAAMISKSEGDFETRRAARFWKEVAKGKEKVNAQELQPGDTLIIGGETVTVSERMPDGKVKLDGGKAFGEVELMPSAEIFVDRVTEGDFTGDPTIDWLDSLKAKGSEGGKNLQAFGLLPEAWNTLIDLVKLGVKGGRKLAEAIEWAFQQFKDNNPGVSFDESGARAHFEAGGADAPKWLEMHSDMQAKEEALRQANHLAVNGDARRAAGLTKAQAAEQRSAATANFRAAQERLRSDPGYVEYLLTRTRDIQRELKAMGAGKGDTRPEESPDVAVRQKKAELESEFEQLLYELEQAPKKLVAAVHDKKFMSGEDRSAREQQAGSEAKGTEGRAEGQVSGGEAAPESAMARRKQVLQDLPERAREVFGAAGKTRERLVHLWQARENRDTITATFDAAENGGNIFGKQAANEVLHELNRSFGAPAERVASRNPVREAALTFVIESGRDEGTLREFRRKIEESPFAIKRAGREALAAIEFAETHWERLDPVAELYNRITDAQVEHENLAGVETLHRKGGYVLHLQDLMASHPLPDIGASGGGFGPASPFLKVRSHATYADAIAAGEVPKSLNAVDLLQKRMGIGQKLINHGAWVDGMRRIVDPGSGLPIIAELQTHVRADGKEYDAAPPGYAMEQYAGQKFAVLRGGYDKLLHSLVTPSTVRNSVAGTVAMEMAGTIKHGMLVFDSYHLGRLMFWNSMVRGMGLPGNPGSHKQGLLLLDQTIPEIRRMIERGEVSAKFGADLVESKRQLGLLIAHGLNVGGAADNIATHFVQHLPIAGTFNKFLFQKFQRGATAEASLIELRRQQQMNPGVPEAVLARRVARDLNTRFGNLQNQSWIKNKTLADVMRIFFLAPQWNESLIRSELGAVKELLQAPGQSYNARRLSVGLLGRSVFTAAVGTFLANQVINYITRGKPTWENEEESEVAKISAWIPDVVGSGPGYFLNPLTLPAEISELIMKKAERNGGDFTKAAKEYFAGRLGPLGRVPWTLATREDEMGAKLKTGNEVLGKSLSPLIPLPLAAGSIYRFTKQLVTGQPEEKYPGQFQRQLAQTAGIKLDSAPNENQRMAALAQKFNREKGITPGAEFYHGDYYDLDRALAVGNEREMRKALAAVLEKKTPKEVREHYKRWAMARFTGKVEREREFRDTLNPEQQATYDTAREKRQEVRARVLDLLP